MKLGDAFGDVVETSLLATHVRAIKNEEITIPNGIVLSSSTINYSRSAKTRVLILHASITIGYDAPWRKVHDRLIEAALATPGVLHDLRPFVWQTALNGFYVTYDINAYTDTPRDIVDIYAALHGRIQDMFYTAGVEIVSPHYTSLRDGNTVAIPEPLRAPGNRAPSFRMEDAGAARDLPKQREGAIRLNVVLAEPFKMPPRSCFVTHQWAASARKQKRIASSHTPRRAERLVPIGHGLLAERFG